MNYCLKLIGAVCLIMLIATTGLHAGQIHDAAGAGDLDKVRALLEANPNLLDSKDQLNHTPLHGACWNGQVAVAHFLIDQGANVNARNEYGVSVLSCAISDKEECFDLVKRLIDKGADINVKKSALGSPLHWAAHKGNLKVVKLLIDNGADLNAPGRHGTTLQWTIMKETSNEEIVKLLLDSGAKLQEYNFGNTELHLAAINGHANLVRILVKHDADVNAKNEYNRTPLYYATMHGHRTTADILIAAGADQSTIVETNYGKAPQLTETLQEVEAYLWYLGGYAPGTGYAVKTRNNLLIFDPYKISESPEAGLASGHLNPNELADQNITILLTRKVRHTFHPTVSELAQRLPVANFVLGAQPIAENEENNNIPAYRLAKAHESFSLGDMQIHTIQTRPSTLSSTGNLGYLIEVDGIKVFHAGLHVSRNRSPEIEKYRQEIDYLKLFGPIDIAILPIRGRHSGAFDYEPYLYLIDELKPKAIYLIGDDLVYQEHRKCLEVLCARNVPVEYPDGGIAIGQRFHYLAPDAQEFTDLYGDYLGQAPPSDTPVVFAPGIVATEDLEHNPASFSPDGNEVYWTTDRPPGPGNSDWINREMTMRRIGNRWTVPVVSPYKGMPKFSPDGHRGYFWSDNDRDIFVIERQGDHWSQSRCLNILKQYPEIKLAIDPSVTKNGSLYFMGIAEGLGMRHDYAIYRMKLMNGKYAKPELLPQCINLPPFQSWTPFVAPDESYLIFSSDRSGQFGGGDLYISFHDIDADGWSEPVNMGEKINSRTQERLPGVSPDGKYLFFTRWIPGRHDDVFWVSAAIIEKLKAKVAQEKRLKTNPR